MAAGAMIWLTQLEIDSPYPTFILPAFVIMAAGMALVFVPLGNTSAQLRAQRRDAAGPLMEVGRDSARGRLILLYGPPGTGKTTVLRTLARQWRDWCQFDCILDPETLFANPAYLMEVALDQAGDCSCPDRRHQKWRLLLLEDCDELIRGEAKQHTGQSLSRLLNLTDGLLGQGRKVLVAISTNEDLARLHPAVVRPGRCLARIEVPALPFGEAETWLGTSAGIPADGATLAELYALRDGHGTTAERAPVLSGQYL